MSYRTKKKKGNSRAPVKANYQTRDENSLPFFTFPIKKQNGEWLLLFKSPNKKPPHLVNATVWKFFRIKN